MSRLKVTESERRLAQKGADFLDRAATFDHGGLYIEKDNGEKLTAELPPIVLRIVTTVLATLAEAGEVVLLASEGEISPEKAARILGISRPLVYQRMDAGKLPFRQVGAHRRILISDVVALKGLEDKRRSFAAALSADAEDLEANYAQPGQSTP